MHSVACAECGITFRYKKRGKPRKYCSKKCSRTVRIRNQNAKRKADGYSYRNTVKGVCAECDREFLGRRQSSSSEDPKYCSKTCSAKVATQASVQARRDTPPRPPVLSQCGWCHQLHTAAKADGGPRAYCSDDCSTKASKARGIERSKDLRSSLNVAIQDGDNEAVLAEVRGRVEVDKSGCWRWPKISKDGYPVVKFGVDGKRRTLQVHRLVLEAKHGAPLGSQAAHHICANSYCVNPDHLQPVTHRENIAEMMARQSLLARVRELEFALGSVEPDHPLLTHIAVV